MKTIFLIFSCLISSLDAKELVARPMKMGGTYNVPLSSEDPQLVKASQFDMSFQVLTAGRGKVSEIRYKLPLELTGHENEIVITEQSGGDWKGELAEAQCSSTSQDFMCRIDYKNLEINFDAATLRIRSTTTDPELLAARLKILADFADEPTGILLFPLKSR